MLIIKNANVYSVNIDGNEVHAEAIAADDEKIIYVGTNEGVKEYESSDAKIIDVQSNTVLPGLCDSHVHATWSGSAKYSCDLFYLAQDGSKKSIVEKVQERLTQYITENVDKKIIKGCGWDYFDFMKELPHKKMLDEICPENQYFLNLTASIICVEFKGAGNGRGHKHTPEPYMGLI